MKMNDIIESIAFTIAIVTVIASYLILVDYLGQALNLRPHELTVFAQLVFYLYLLVGKCILDRI